MRLVHKEPIHTQFLEGDHIVLPLFGLKLPQTAFELLPGTLHLFDGELLAPHEFQFLNALGDLLDLLLQEPFLASLRHGDFFKLTVADNDRVIVAGGDPGAEATAVVLLKILLGRHQNFGRGIQPQEFRGPLFCQVIGHHEHGLAAQAQALAFHSRSNHFIGLACAYHMGKQRIPAIKCMRNRVPLMLPERNLWIHTGEGNVLSVIFAGANTVEQLIVFLHKGFASVRILPYPVAEGVLDGLLFLLRKRCGFLIQNALFLALGILDGVIDANIPEIQRILQDAQAAGTVRAVGQVIRNIVVGKTSLSADAPFRSEVGILHLHRAPLIERHLKQLVHELLDVFLIHPGRAKPHINFGRIQILGLRLFQRFHIRLKDG